MRIHNYSGDEIIYEKIGFKQIGEFVNMNNSIKLNGEDIIEDERPLIKLSDGRILHFHSSNNYIHIFNNLNDLINFFDKKKTNGIAIWYKNDLPIYWYSLIPSEIQTVFASQENKILLKFLNDLEILYEIKGKEGVFLLTNNGHFNQAYWYPSLEIFNIDRADMIRYFGK